MVLICNHLKRTQIQLEERQVEALNKLAADRGQSMAHLIRSSIDLFVKQEGGARSDTRIERAKRVAGKFSSGSSDGSRLHDRHLADTFGAK